MPIRINMRSAANLVKGQGVGSCFEEQVRLVSEGLPQDFEVTVNSRKPSDIVHYHTVNFGYYLERLFSRKNTQGIGYVHFLPDTIEDSLKLPKLFRVVFYKYLLNFYNSMDYLVTVNPCIIEKLEDYDVTNPKIVYIPNYVSEMDFYEQSVEEKKIQRARYAIPEDRFVVVGAGQLQTRKGIVDFVKVAQQLPEVQFVWAGGFSFGKITDGYEEIKKIVEHPPANVKFLGIVDRQEMNHIYNLANLFFLPSFDELFPMTILEALCCKTPLLLRDVELYENILFDYYLKGKNVNDFAAVIQQLQSESSFLAQWQEKAWECHLLYCKERILDMWEEIYREAYENGLFEIAEFKRSQIKND